jgi:hypothetical protein
MLAAYWRTRLVGLAALMLLSSVWAGAYFFGAVLYHAQGAAIGVLRQLVAIAVIAIVADWREAPQSKDQSP